MEAFHGEPLAGEALEAFAGEVPPLAESCPKCPVTVAENKVQWRTIWSTASHQGDIKMIAGREYKWGETKPFWRQIAWASAELMGQKIVNDGQLYEGLIQGIRGFPSTRWIHGKTVFCSRGLAKPAHRTGPHCSCEAKRKAKAPNSQNRSESSQTGSDISSQKLLFIKTWPSCYMKKY